MNAAPTSSHAFLLQDTRPRRGLAVAVGVSVLLHALLLYGFRQPRPAPAPPQPAPQALTVWLRAPVPPPRLRPAPPLVATPVRHNAEPGKPAVRPAPVISVSPPAAPEQGAAQSTPADPFAETPPARPAFDIEAAHRVVRQVATERDPAKVGTAVGQIPDKPLPDQSELARNIDSAKRRDCKDGVPGGLLAPLLLLMDKKDSGCKW